MGELAVADFDAFCREVHGHTPFPWQQRLLERVVDRGWPELIDVPTGLGKTAVIDVAVFASALGAEQARRRIFFVVDRRLVVDEAFEHANRLRRSFEEAPARGPVTQQVAEQLRAEGDDDKVVLETTRMRGGVDWSWNWLERPDRHAVVVGTVDQVGSRLFFRGYGVGQQIRPIDAALVGTDSLIVVDEAHLSGPFLTSARDALAHDAPEHRQTGQPLLVAMTASPRGADARVHRLDEDDLAHPEAARRLGSHKELHALSVKTTKKNVHQVVPAALARSARHLGEAGKVVLVVCNSIARARAVHDDLSAERSNLEQDSSTAVLLIGRNRPLARDYLLHDWYEQIRAGRETVPNGVLYVVATQTVEVGANIDADALVTEAASLPALLQRLGRLNRLGRRSPARALVVAGTTDTSGVYGEARDATWEWVTRHTPARTLTARSFPDLDGAGLDVSPQALRDLTNSVPEQERSQLTGDEPYVPTLNYEVLEAWTATDPAPSSDPALAPFLHGIDHGEPQVTLVWRSDVDVQHVEASAAALAAIPPAGEEGIELPLPTVRQWLRTGPAPDIEASDIEGAPHEAIPTAAGNGQSRRALRYAPDGTIEPVAPGELVPGDLLVVPTDYGGCDIYGWAPNSRTPVIDLGDLVGGHRHRRATCRLIPTLDRVLDQWDPELAPAWTDARTELAKQLAEEDGPFDPSRLTELLKRLREDFERIEKDRGRWSDALPHMHILRTLVDRPAAMSYTSTTDQGTERVHHLLVSARKGISVSGDATTAGSAATGKPMGLRSHQLAVRKRAEEFGRNLALPAEVVNSVALAAEWHDEGKRDDRCQCMLHGGNAWLAAAAPEPLAKSGLDPTDRQAFVRAWRRSDYPAGMRHEALSARIASGRLDSRTANGDSAIDTDLVLHLIAAHHGHNRPLLPPVNDPQPITVTDDNGRAYSSDHTVDHDAPERLTRLNQRYGRWNLARLEAVVRLADIWCSARQEEKK
jgi:CRISPR-associated endonuclease/helicase Cas3